MKIVLIIVYLVLCVIMSIWFIGAGYSGPDTVPENTSNTSGGNWLLVDGTETLYHYSCPGNGKIVGDVWSDGGAWAVHAYSRTSWEKLEEHFVDKAHATLAAEKFIRVNKICD